MAQAAPTNDVDRIAHRWGEGVAIGVAGLFVTNMLWSFFAHTAPLTPAPEAMTIGAAAIGIAMGASFGLLVWRSSTNPWKGALLVLMTAPACGIFATMLCVAWADRIASFAEFGWRHNGWKPAIYRIDSIHFDGKGGPAVEINPYRLVFSATLPMDRYKAAGLRAAMRANASVPYCVTVMEQRAGSAVRIRHHKTSADPYPPIAPCQPGLNS